MGNNCLKFRVILVEDFKFDVLLGNDFLKSQHAVIDCGRKFFRLGVAEIPIQPLPSDCIAILKSVVDLPVGLPVRVKAELIGNHCGLALLGERQLVRADERVLIAPVVTDSNNSVLIKLVNTTRSTVSLQPFIAEVATIQEEYAVEDMSEVPVEDLNLSHLSRKQQADLCSVLTKHHAWPQSGQWSTTHLVEHPIDLQGAHPVRQRPYQVPETKKQQIAKEIQKTLLSNVIRPSCSPWSSPLLLLGKPNGEFRFCIYFRPLSAETKKDAYPLPRIDETLDALGKAVWLTTLGLQSGFWQIPVQDSDIEKIALATHHGHREFSVMPFGLANAPAKFQRLMDLVSSGLHWTQCLVYLDNVVVFAAREEEHMQRLDLVLGRIARAGLTLKPVKCQWTKNSVTFLGHIISSEGVSVDTAKMKSVSSFPLTKNSTDVRNLLHLLPTIEDSYQNLQADQNRWLTLRRRSVSLFGPKKCKHHLKTCKTV